MGFGMTTELKTAETSLAETIPPMEADHKAALEKYLATSARDLTDADFDVMVRLYREKRRIDASARLERERKRTEKETKRIEREAKKLAKGTPK